MKKEVLGCGYPWTWENSETSPYEPHELGEYNLWLWNWISTLITRHKLWMTSNKSMTRECELQFEPPWEGLTLSLALEGLDCPGRVFEAQTIGAGNLGLVRFTFSSSPGKIGARPAFSQSALCTAGGKRNNCFVWLRLTCIGFCELDITAVLEKSLLATLFYPWLVQGHHIISRFSIIYSWGIVNDQGHDSPDCPVLFGLTWSWPLTEWSNSLQ